jgi:hypothetical protein
VSLTGQRFLMFLAVVELDLLALLVAMGLWVLQDVMVREALWVSRYQVLLEHQELLAQLAQRGRWVLLALLVLMVDLAVGVHLVSQDPRESRVSRVTLAQQVQQDKLDHKD